MSFIRNDTIPSGLVLKLLVVTEITKIFSNSAIYDTL